MKSQTFFSLIDLFLIYSLPFYPEGLSRESKIVETMLFTGEFKYHNSDKYDCQLIGLRYQKQLTTMYIILPNNSTRDKLKSFQTSLTADNIEELIQASSERLITSLSIPKFNINNEINLGQILRKLGVTTLFSGAADLSAIAAGRNEPEAWYKPGTAEKSIENLERIKNTNTTMNPGLYVSEIIHKIQLTVNEVGTEGGAATAALIDRIMGSNVEVETPFLLLIRQDYTRLPLFYGPIFEP